MHDAINKRMIGRATDLDFQPGESEKFCRRRGALTSNYRGAKILPSLSVFCAKLSLEKGRWRVQRRD